MNSLFDLTDHQVIKKAPGSIKETIKVSGKIAQAVKEARARIVKEGWPKNYRVVTDRSGMVEIAALVRRNKDFFFDVETSGLDPWHDRVYCIAITAGEMNFVIPFEHQLQKCAKVADFVETLGPLFNDPSIRLINHNVKFDCHMLEENFGIEIGPIHCDTLLLELFLNPGKMEAHGLKEIAAYRYYVAPPGGNYTQQFGKTAWSHIDPLVANFYACHDTELVSKVYTKQCVLLNASAKTKMHRLFWQYEMPVLNESYIVERRGLRVDEDYFWNDLKPWCYSEYGKAVVPLRSFIDPWLTEFTVGSGRAKRPATIIDVLESPAKLGTVFFDFIGIPEIKGVTLVRDFKAEHATGAGQIWKRTLDKNAIAELSSKFECMRLLGDYRKIATVKKLFVDQIAKMIINGRIHCTVNTIGTETGRMSMANPNFQQMPSKMGPRVRNCFLPDEGKVLVSMDFSQQELRIMAHLSQDERLKQIYFDDKDIYSETAYSLLGEDVVGPLDTEEQKKASKPRADAKILILGLGFGMQYKKYAKNAKIPESEAKKRFATYHETYPGVGEYTDRAVAFAQENGYIVTMMGRERPLRNINSDQKGWRAKDERAAGNTPVQGSAADMTKKATVIARNKFMKELGWPVEFWLWVHDEIIYQVDKEWARSNPHLLEQIRVSQANALKLSVPMKCSCILEERWGTEVRLDEIDTELLEDLEDVA